MVGGARRKARLKCCRRGVGEPKRAAAATVAKKKAAGNGSLPKDFSMNAGVLKDLHYKNRRLEWPRLCINADALVKSLHKRRCTVAPHDYRRSRLLDDPVGDVWAFDVASSDSLNRA